MGWSKDVPRNGDWYVGGWYFQRRLSNHARQIVEINSHGPVWRVGTANTKFVIDLRETGDYEWLGPITPEQAEQFDALRKAATEADEALQLVQGFDWQLDSSAHGEEIRRRAISAMAALRRALGKQE